MDDYGRGITFKNSGNHDVTVEPFTGMSNPAIVGTVVRVRSVPVVRGRATRLCSSTRISTRITRDHSDNVWGSVHSGFVERLELS
jgi:hypothetical protein